MDLKYNTEQKRLILPEYGRNIQNMVDHCLSIKDKDERTSCAYTIIATMGNLFPHLRDINDFKHILWDHLAVMSDFKLDIDYPYEVVKQETNTKPDTIPYSSFRQIKYLHYGKTIPILINKALQIEDEEEKKQLIYMIANHMKRCYSAFNKEGMDDRKIFDDIREMSNGAIKLDESEIKLFEYKEPVAKPTTGKKKKK